MSEYDSVDPAGEEQPAPLQPPRPPQPGDLINPFSQPYGPPYFTYGMLVTIIAIFALTLFSGLINNQGLVLYEFGATFGPNIIYGGEVWRLLTSMFLHADVTHILFNGFALYVLGPDMERLYGIGRYAIIYFLAGLYGSLASFALNGLDEFSVGASGAIFGIIGVQLAFFTFYRKKLGRFGEERFKSMLQLVGINLIIGFVVVRINSTAHIGGLIAGFVLGYALVPQIIVEAVTPLGIVARDRNRLGAAWWVVALAAAVLVAGVTGALFFWRTLLSV